VQLAASGETDGDNTTTLLHRTRKPGKPIAAEAVHRTRPTRGFERLRATLDFMPIENFLRAEFA
jgi:hypothetical protein